MDYQPVPVEKMWAVALKPGDTEQRGTKWQLKDGIVYDDDRSLSTYAGMLQSIFTSIIF
jgi:hypothetical protein